MPPQPSLDHLLEVARTVGLLLAKHAEPVTFWLGAGASMSSGAPSTTEALDALRELLAGRGISDVRNITELPGDITAFERSNALAPLFAHVVPHIGLRLLASLGRDRSVRVLTTNWDDGVEAACERLGVVCRPFDVRHMNDDDWAACDDGKPGVVVLHLHGTLTDPLYSAKRTLKFAEGARDRIGNVFLRHTTLFLGASLSGEDSDISELLQNAWSARGGDRDRPITYFGRGEPDQGEGAPVAALEPGDRRNGVFVHSGADFDRLVLEIVGNARGVRWRTDVDRSLVLPDRLELVLPAAPLLRRILDEPVVALVAEPEVGKTTLGYLLAHVDRLVTGAPTVDCADGGKACLAAVGATPTAPVLLDDPFGTRAYQPTPGLLTRLDELAPANSGAPSHPAARVVVTSSRGPWAQAMADATGGGQRVAVVDEPTDAWYRDADLRRLVPSDQHDVLARLRQLATPRRIHEAIAGRPVSSDPVSDHVLALQQDPDAALLIALVRLLDLTDDPQPAETLAALSASDSTPAELLGRLRWALDLYELDGVQYLRLRRAAHADAADVIIGLSLDDPLANASRLGGAVAAEAWAREAMARFALLRTVSRGSQLADTTWTATELAPFLPAVFARSGNPALVTGERYAALDRWGIVELATELVRVWPTTRSSEGALELLERILADADGHGTYAVAETVLYFGESADREIVDRLVAACWDLLDPRRDRLVEAVRVFDGLLWKPAPGELGSASWVQRLVGAIDGGEDWGAFVAACAQHPASLHVLKAAHVRHPLAGPVSLTGEQAIRAAEMIAWHFAHQARNRAVTVRHADVDMPALRRRRPSVLSPDLHGAGRLVEALASRHGQLAGWGVLLGATLACTESVAIDDDILAQTVDNLTGVDDAVALAAATFELGDETRLAVRRRFDADGRWSRRLLAVICGGADINGQKIAPPRFRFARDTKAIRDELRLHTEALDILSGEPLDTLVARLLAVVDEAAAAEGVERRYVTEVVDLVRQGEVQALAVGFRPLAESAVRIPPLVAALGAAARLLRESAPIQDALL